MSAEIDQVVPCITQSSGEFLLQIKPSMIGCVLFAFVHSSRPKDNVSGSRAIIYGWVLPTARRGDSLSLVRSPSLRVIFINGRASLECRIDDSPGFFDVIFTGEQCGISRHGIGQYPFIGVHLFGTGMP